MKNYGGRKATEFTKKQVSVVYGAAKRGELKVEKWYMSHLYNLADFYGYDDNGTAATNESYVLPILNAVFAGEMEAAQELIDQDTERVFETYTKKYRDAFDRTIVA